MVASIMTHSVFKMFSVQHVTKGKD